MKYVVYIILFLQAPIHRSVLIFQIHFILFRFFSRIRVNGIYSVQERRVHVCQKKSCVCVLGVAWLGTTFVSAHIEEINVFAGSLLEAKPWLLAVVLFFAAMLLYSQAATTRALMPAALALGISPVAAIASFGAVGSLFVLPTYPTLLAAVEFDDTGSTRIGKYVFDHPFLIPGTIAIALSVVIGFMIAPIIL
jgi:anaerobic C4-dicarboxylate transporter DcuA